MARAELLRLELHTMPASQANSFMHRDTWQPERSPALYEDHEGAARAHNKAGSTSNATQGCFRAWKKGIDEPLVGSYTQNIVVNEIPNAWTQLKGYLKSRLKLSFAILQD